MGKRAPERKHKKIFLFCACSEKNNVVESYWMWRNRNHTRGIPISRASDCFWENLLPLEKWRFSMNIYSVENVNIFKFLCVREALWKMDKIQIGIFCVVFPSLVVLLRQKWNGNWKKGFGKDLELISKIATKDSTDSLSEQFQPSRLTAYGIIWYGGKTKGEDNGWWWWGG